MRSLSNGSSFQLDMQDRHFLLGRQTRQQLADIPARIGGLIVRRCKNIVLVVDRISQGVFARSGPEIVREFIPGYCMYPGRQRFVRSIGVASIMYGQKDFLYQVFDVILHVGQTLTQIAAKVARQIREEVAIRTGVSFKSRPERRFQTGFGVVQELSPASQRRMIANRLRELRFETGEPPVQGCWVFSVAGNHLCSCLAAPDDLESVGTDAIQDCLGHR